MFLDGNENKLVESLFRRKICKNCGIYGYFNIPTSDQSLLESCQFYISAKYKASYPIMTQELFSSFLKA